MVNGAFASGPPIVTGALRPPPGPVDCLHVEFGLLATSSTAFIA